MSTPSATLVERVLDRFFLHGKVEVIEDITRRMRRIRITGESLRDLSWTPGQHVRLQVGNLGSAQTWTRGLRDALRTYSVWDYDNHGRLDLCILDHHGTGPGAHWSRHVWVGQRVAFTRPEGRLVVREGAPYHLFAGDETASVAFGAMLRTLPASVRVHGAIEVSGPEDRLPLPRSSELAWAYRNTAPTGTGLLVRALRALDLPTEPGIAYVAGEARVCQAIRRHLTQERNWPRKAIVVKPFWAPGKRGLD